MWDVDGGWRALRRGGPPCTRPTPPLTPPPRGLSSSCYHGRREGAWWWPPATFWPGSTHSRRRVCGGRTSPSRREGWLGWGGRRGSGGPLAAHSLAPRSLLTPSQDAASPPPSPGGAEDVLIRYVSALRGRGLPADTADALAARVAALDWSSARADLVASVPGTHYGELWRWSKGRGARSVGALGRGWQPPNALLSVQPSNNYLRPGR